MAKTSTTKVKPLDDRVVIKPMEAEERTAGGIVLPDTAKEKPQKGTIVATGPGRLLEDGSRGEMSVKVGDVVYYGKYSGTEIEFDGENYVVIRENDLLAVVD